LLATSWYMIVFRLIHILAGIFWVGSVTLLVRFVSPAVTEVGPAAGPVMANLVLKRRMVRAILGGAAVTIVAGAFLYWHDWQAYGSFGDWVSSRFGFAMTVGGLFAIAAVVIGGLVVRPAMEGAVQLGAQIAASGAPPSPEDAARIEALRARGKMGSQTVWVLVLIASALMATARYW
jgi:uncharacterized membrane protein